MIELKGVSPLLQVFDMPTSVRFYCDRLGFEIVSSSPIVHGAQGDYFHFALLRRGEIVLMLNTAYDEGERPAQPDPARVSAHSDTALFFGCPDVEAACCEVRQAGVAISEEPFVTKYGMKRFGVLDPDGYNLCFQWPV